MQKITDFLMTLPNEYKKPYIFQENLDIKRAFFPKDYFISPIFVWAESSELYCEDSLVLSNKNPHNVKIFEEFKNENSSNFFLLMEYLKEARNLEEILQKDRNALNLLEILNIIYQLCECFLPVIDSPLKIPEVICPFQIYLQGSFVKTDMFISLKRSSSLETPKDYQLEGKNDCNSTKETNIIYFIAVVFHKLLTNHLNLNEENYKEKIDENTRSLLKEMINIGENSQNEEAVPMNCYFKEIMVKLKNIYKELFLFEISWENKENLKGVYKEYSNFFKENSKKNSNENSNENKENSNENKENLFNCQNIRLKTIEIQRILKKSLKNENNKEDFICLNLFFGYICIYLRKLIVKPLAISEKIDSTIANWIIEVEKENQKYERDFLLYYDLALEIHKEKSCFPQIFKGDFQIRRDFSDKMIDFQSFFKKNSEFLEKKTSLEFIASIKSLIKL